MITQSSLATTLKLGILSICTIYIAKNLLRDLQEFRSSRREKDRNEKEKRANEAGEWTMKNLGDNSISSNSSLEEEYRIPVSVASKSGRQCEVLVHNIAHTDLIFELNTMKSSSNGDPILGRPRFSAFSFFSEMILKRLRKTMKFGELDLAFYPVYDRKEMKLTTPRKQRNIPVGFKNFDMLQLSDEDVPNMRIRGSDLSRFDQNSDTLVISSVLFPLLSVLVPTWLDNLKEKGCSNAKKVMILVSGVGTPRDYTHEVKGNSTKFCAELMEIFITTLFPEITVVRVHSERSNIFRYDENISFVKSHLLPKVQCYRDCLARNLPYPDERNYAIDATSIKHSFNPELAENFSVSISFADGSPARTHAIQSCLRSFHPTYFHIWQLKTFWHDRKLCYDDLEVFSFSEIDTTPALDVNLLDKKKTESKEVKLVIDEMLRFKVEYLESVLLSNSDVKDFWLRKTKKPVLSVLLVRKGESGEVKLYRGTNMEVSMPTGSLCAERNVIGTALASDPSLRREDLRVIAVLAIPLPKEEVAVGNSSVKYLKDMLAKELSVAKGEIEKQISSSLRERKMRRSSSIGSFHSIIEEDEKSSEVLLSDPPSLSSSRNTTPLFIGETSDLKINSIDISSPQRPPPSDPSDFDSCPSPKSVSLPGTPKRKIRLYDHIDKIDISEVLQKVDNKQCRRTVFLQTSIGDINPLKPCGACNEWLKKIAECNPYFKVLTFTDADCNGVYIQHCQE